MCDHLLFLDFVIILKQQVIIPYSTHC